jgi:hypothetical protein
MMLLVAYVALRTGEEARWVHTSRWRQSPPPLSPTAPLSWRATALRPKRHSATIITGLPPLTAQQVTERILIGHVRGHLATVRTAIGGS